MPKGQQKTDNALCLQCVIFEKKSENYLVFMPKDMEIQIWL